MHQYDESHVPDPASLKEDDPRHFLEATGRRRRLGLKRSDRTLSPRTTRKISSVRLDVPD